VTKLLWAGPVLAQPSPKTKQEEKYVGPSLAHPFWADISPLIPGSVLGPVIWVSPAHMF